MNQKAHGAWLLCALLACGRRGFESRGRDAGRDALGVDSPAADAALVTGCADGERDAFIDPLAFPAIAGCNATWTTARNLRAQRTIRMECADDPRLCACGDDDGLGECAEPADACSVGWHLCLLTGDPTELSGKISGAACAAADGAFVAAAGHCENCMAPCTNPDECIYEADAGVPLDCSTIAISCAEPVCCGTACGGSPNCRAGVLGPLATVTDTSPCGSFLSPSQTGVMCCAD